MRRTRILSAAVMALVVAACSDPMGSRTMAPDRASFDELNTMGSGGRSSDSGNTMGSGTNVGDVPFDTATVTTTGSDTTNVEERGTNTFGSGT